MVLLFDRKLIMSFEKVKYSITLAAKYHKKVDDPHQKCILACGEGDVKCKRVLKIELIQIRASLLKHRYPVTSCESETEFFTTEICTVHIYYTSSSSVMMCLPLLMVLFPDDHLHWAKILILLVYGHPVSQLSLLHQTLLRY